MHKKNGSVLTLVAVLAASVLVVAAIALLVYFSGDLRSGGIVLPDKDTEKSNEPEAEDPSEAGFVTLTTENAPDVVRTLARPAYYHQTLRARVPAGEDAAVTEIDLWVRENLWKIVRHDASGVRCILTDGRLAYLWYMDDVRSITSRNLPEGLTRDELAGIVTYEAITATEPQYITEAAYSPLAVDSELSCLSVRTLNGNEGAAYQIDLSTGLLLSAELMRDGESTYEIHQTDLELLSADDASLTDAMRLPFGTAEFSAEAETPQE